MTQNMTLAYKNNSIQTASPAELTLMLYDGAIKFCNIALGAIENGDVQKANTNIIKAEKIITEFRATLDFKYPVAKDFELVYDYIYRRLVEANIHKDAEVLTEALSYIREMRDTWKEVMRLNRVQNATGPKIQYVRAPQTLAMAE
ncbi:MAG: flagellar export chaperone FliS [Lachnospiraceae bacterium]|nr:flagellar export chaperone FliS [Lachnospiraceae bacterium]